MRQPLKPRLWSHQTSHPRDRQTVPDIRSSAPMPVRHYAELVQAVATLSFQALLFILWSAPCAH